MFLKFRILAGWLCLFGSGCFVHAQDSAVADPPPANKQAGEKQAGEKQAGEKQAGEEQAGADKSKRAGRREQTERFVRLTKTAKGAPKALETSIVRYAGPTGSRYEGVIVDLVGVVHIGQEEYYEELDRRLSKYDVVLYELVAPDGTRVRPEDIGNRDSPLSAVQLGMRDMLNLEFQLEHINYLAKNFRHADMSPEEFMEDMEKRGDSLLKMGLRMMGAGLASASAQGGDAGMLIALMAGDDRPKKMKQAMAKQLIDVEVMTAGLDDASGNNTLIRGRNVKAFQIMEEELKAGKKRLAVFYGAGHLPDMAERLEREYSMRPTGSEWFAAWDLQRN
ncbi:hypothetical protein SH139x_003738 [Planctomycetaceae bacterium SH139]